MTVMSMGIRKAHEGDQPALLRIWQASVTATHHFLSETDIDALRPIVRDQALPHLEVWVLCDAASQPIGWMGLDGNRLEALFLSPHHTRQGGGKRLLAHARQLKGALQLDVNEQNPQALAFYLANGFVVAGRSAVDGQGQPYPLLHLTEADESSACAIEAAGNTQRSTTQAAPKASDSAGQSLAAAGSCTP